MKNKIISVVLIILMMICSPIICNAEGDYSMTLDFTNKVGDKIIWITVNGTQWEEWQTNSNNTFYSDDDKYTISIVYNPSDGLVPYVLYDESWNDSVSKTNFCIKGCSYDITIDNSEHKDKFELTFTTGYNITFETNGGTEIDPLFVEKDTKPVKPNDPTKKDFVFDGWYTNVGLSEDFDFNNTISSDITLYAGWKEKEYNYEFIEGNNQKLVIDNIKSLILKIDGDYSLFESIKVGGLELVKDEDYTVSEGSTVITFTENGINKLNALGKGEYEILVKYSNDKEVTGVVTIKQKDSSSPGIENPQTGDNFITYLITGIISLIGIICISIYAKKN